VLCRDLGAHIDGFIAVQATTVVVQADAAQAVTGRSADALACANSCFEAALRLIRPGKRISGVSGPLNTIAEAFGCSMVEGVMTHNMKQFVIDGNKCVLNKPTTDTKVEDGEFEENEVYAIDIVISTGASFPLCLMATRKGRVCWRHHM
jgi:methionine aminopeptidase